MKSDPKNRNSRKPPIPKSRHPEEGKQNQHSEGKNLDAVRVSSISPTWRRNRNEIMREIDEHINQMPMPDGVGVGIGTSLDPLVVEVAAGHVMTDEDPGARGRVRIRREMDGGAIEWEVEGVEVGSGEQIFQLFDGVCDGNRGLGRIKWISSSSRRRRRIGRLG